MRLFLHNLTLYETSTRKTILKIFSYLLCHLSFKVLRFLSLDLLASIRRLVLMAYPKSRGCPWVILVPVMTLTAVEFMAWRRQGALELTIVHKGGSPSLAPRLTTMIDLLLSFSSSAASEVVDLTSLTSKLLVSSPEDIFPVETPFFGNNDLQLQKISSKR